MDSCPICLDELMEHYSFNCNHIFCQTCIFRHLNYSVLCPLCREVFTYMSPSPYANISIDIRGEFMGKFMGITLADNEDGVYVRKLKRNDVASKYLKKNDIISHINGIPLFTHTLGIYLIDHLTKKGDVIHITSQGPMHTQKGTHCKYQILE